MKAMNSPGPGAEPCLEAEFGAYRPYHISQNTSCGKIIFFRVINFCTVTLVLLLSATVPICKLSLVKCLRKLLDLMILFQ